MILIKSKLINLLPQLSVLFELRLIQMIGILILKFKHYQYKTMCSNIIKLFISVCLFSYSRAIFMVFMFCNVDLGEIYNLLFLSINILLIAVFFIFIVYYCYKYRLEKKEINHIDSNPIFGSFIN
jgi:hypothetical protein